MPIGLRGFQKGNKLAVGGKGNSFPTKMFQAGHTITEETRKKISESMKGKKNSLGRKFSETERKSRGILIIQTKEEKSNNHKKRFYLRKYNCTEQDFNIIFKLQNGKCAICGIHQSSFKKSLSLDHCHATNKVRGLLCQKCNFMLGLAKDSIEILKNALIYLAKHKEMAGV